MAEEPTHPNPESTPPPPEGAPPEGTPPEGAPPPPPPGGPQDTLAPGPPSKDDMNLAMLAHLLGIFTGFLGPLVIWLVKKEDSAYIEEQGREALNFQITMAIAWIVSGVLTFVLIGCLLVPIVFVVVIVFGILAAVAASKGEHYRYPVTLRLVK